MNLVIFLALVLTVLVNFSESRLIKFRGRMREYNTDSLRKLAQPENVQELYFSQILDHTSLGQVSYWQQVFILS
jgi:hypothetical protein